MTVLKAVAPVTIPDFESLFPLEATTFNLLQTLDKYYKTTSPQQVKNKPHPVLASLYSQTQLTHYFKMYKARYDELFIQIVFARLMADCDHRHIAARHEELLHLAWNHMAIFDKIYLALQSELDKDIAKLEAKTTKLRLSSTSGADSQLQSYQIVLNNLRSQQRDLSKNPVAMKEHIQATIFLHTELPVAPGVVKIVPQVKGPKLPKAIDFQAFKDPVKKEKFVVPDFFSSFAIESEQFDMRQMFIDHAILHNKKRAGNTLSTYENRRYKVLQHTIDKLVTADKLFEIVYGAHKCITDIDKELHIAGSKAAIAQQFQRFFTTNQAFASLYDGMLQSLRLELAADIKALDKIIQELLQNKAPAAVIENARRAHTNLSTQLLDFDMDPYEIISNLHQTVFWVDDLNRKVKKTASVAPLPAHGPLTKEMHLLHNRAFQIIESYKNSLSYFNGYGAKRADELTARIQRCRTEKEFIEVIADFIKHGKTECDRSTLSFFRSASRASGTDRNSLRGRLADAFVSTYFGNQPDHLRAANMHSYLGKPTDKSGLNEDFITKQVTSAVAKVIRQPEPQVATASVNSRLKR